MHKAYKAAARYYIPQDVLGKMSLSTVSKVVYKLQVIYKILNIRWSIEVEMKLILRAILPLLILLSPLIFFKEVHAQSESRVVRVYYFWGDGCPVCAQQKPFVDELARKYPQVKVYSLEVWYVQENRDMFFAMAAQHGFEPQGVPTTFIADQVWVGFRDHFKSEMESAVVNCTVNTCPDYGRGIVHFEPEREISTQPDTSEPVTEPLPGRSNVIDIPFMGTINLDQHSLFFSTAIISFVDGFNPCSLWVLSILLALVIHTGSRKKIFLVGFTFLLVTTAVYGLFITGLFSVFTFVSYLGWIQVLVALLALSFALVNIKDYFWFKSGVSFTISDKHKPRIYKGLRGIMESGKSSWALIGATVAMALGIALVELPCTAGFPVLWTNIVSAQNVGTGTFVLLLGFYMLIYLLDELVIFLTAVVTLKASKFEEKHGRVLKLIGGMVMLTLAMVLLINPELMNNISDSLLIFAGAFLATLMILVLHRKVLPSLGIRIGSEFRQAGIKKVKRRRA
jgi:cytochrome c biogenesis protein CcdA/thiol-disulfide isomerase/thioredoxin